MEMAMAKEAFARRVRRSTAFSRWTRLGGGDGRAAPPCLSRAKNRNWIHSLIRQKVINPRNRGPTWLRVESTKFQTPGRVEGAWGTLAAATLLCHGNGRSPATVKKGSVQVSRGVAADGRWTQAGAGSRVIVSCLVRPTIL